MERAGGVDAGASARIAAGTPEFRRTNIAIFFCGFSIFAILYCTQPVLPLFSETFGVSAAESSLALSLTTATMAFAMLFASSLSEVVGRKSMMLGALLASSALTFVLAFAQDWSQVLWLRALAGVTLSGMPAVALAYLAEEMEPKAVASAVGIYIGGGAFGGMSGRLITAALADYGSWRLAIAALALTGFASAFVFWRALPASQYFEARTPSLSKLASSMLACARNPGIALLLVLGFLLLGGFMTVYNYLGFRLQAEPFLLTQALAGLIFVVYPAGSIASAFMGGQAAKYGRGPVLVASLCLMTFGLVLMTPDHLASIAAGLVILTFGFFGAHAIASGWAATLVAKDKAQASSLYLLFYYVGGGAAGTAGGVFWANAAWPGVALFAGAMMAGTIVVALLLWRIAPR
ncbi:MAG: MFS transporter [Beijerinckiaceae bacterium]|nr:MFS transporter [Beijerinckiaceae bacterium]